MVRVRAAVSKFVRCIVNRSRVGISEGGGVPPSGKIRVGVRVNNWNSLAPKKRNVLEVHCWVWPAINTPVSLPSVHCNVNTKYFPLASVPGKAAPLKFLQDALNAVSVR